MDTTAQLTTDGPVALDAPSPPASPLAPDAGPDALERAECELFARDKRRWFEAKMRAEWQTYTETVSVPTTVLTFNVGEMDPLASSWQGLVTTDTPLYIVALQEMDMSLGGIMTVGQSALLETWEVFLKAGLPNQRCRTVVAWQNGGLGLFIFADERVAPAIHDRTVQTVSVGKLGMANKGAVAVSFCLHTSSVLVVAAHFNANAGAARCDEDFRTIRAALAFPVAPEQHDYEIWVGDLNYRLDAPPETVLAGLGAPEGLLRYDQLLCSQHSGAAFSGFIEPPITFRPTYRLIKGADEYDTKRTPAWCDRVLFRISQLYKLSIHSYTRVDFFKSDHCPVSCACVLKPRRVNTDRMLESWNAVLDLSNRLSTALMPTCAVSKTRLVFGALRPYMLVEDHFTLTNTGRSVARVNFALFYLDESRVLAPPWFSCDPCEVKLKPGQSRAVTTALLVEVSNMRFLRSSPQLILRVMIDGGREYYADVAFTVDPSAFGLLPVELLAHPEPFLQFQSSQRFPKTPVAKEVALFVSAFVRNRQNPLLFTSAPSHACLTWYETILLSVDTMKELHTFDVCCTSEAFLLFLEAMGGILPPVNHLSPAPWVVDQTCTPENRRVVRVVLALCKEVCAAQPARRLDELVAYFVPSLVGKRLDPGPTRDIAGILVQYALEVRPLSAELTAVL